MNKKRFEEGNKKRKKVLGTKYVNRAIKDKNLFNEDNFTKEIKKIFY